MADELGEIFAQLNSCFSENKILASRWNDAKCYYECLKIKVKDADSRERTTFLQIVQTKHAIICCIEVLKEKMLKPDEIPEACVETITEAMRFLRNVCAGSPKSQDTVMSSGIVEQVMKIMHILMSPLYKESRHSNKVNDAMKSMMQLLGNYVVGNATTQDNFWELFFPDFCLSVMTSTNYDCQNVMCMVIFNCLTPERRLSLVSCQSGLKIMSQILHLSADSDNLEWSYFILESFVKSGQLADLYQGLEFDPSARIILLDLIQVHLTGERAQDQNQETSSIQKLCGVSEDSVVFLAREFESQSTALTASEEIDFHSAEVMMNAIVISRLLKVISSAAAHLKCLQNQHQLLVVAIDLLRHTNNPINCEHFSNIQSAQSTKDSSELDPSHGFKRDLVQLIGNMCYKNRSNQDMVRNKDGIALILDHCNIDDHNPYICQWAVFALRNLLEDNIDNQRIIASLDNRGVIDHSRLNRFGIDVEKTADGKTKLSLSK